MTDVDPGERAFRSEPPSASVTMNVLVTGGAGYLGGTLVRRLIQADAAAVGTVRILDNLHASTPQALLDLPTGNPCEFLEGDILDPTAVERALEGVDTVVHLAAIGSTPFRFDDHDTLEQVNRWGTVRFLDQCLDAGVERFVFSSSASVYGPGAEYREEAPCHPVGPYSTSKRQAEEAILERSKGRLQSTVLRLGMLFGGSPPLIRFDSFANRFAYLGGTGRSITVYGTGTQQRPVLHVDDGARAILHALTSETEGSKRDASVYNVVGANVTVGAIAEVVSDLTGVPIRYTEQDYRDHISLSVDGSAFRQTGWEPKTGPEAGLRALIERFEAVRGLRRPAIEIS